MKIKNILLVINCEINSITAKNENILLNNLRVLMRIHLLTLTNTVVGQHLLIGNQVRCLDYPELFKFDFLRQIFLVYPRLVRICLYFFIYLRF